MKVKLLVSAVFLIVAGTLLFASDYQKSGTGKAGEASKLEIEKCSACGKEVHLRIHPDQTMTVLCPGCGGEMALKTQNGYRMTFNCASCDKDLQIRYTTDNKAVITCPGCSRDMVLRCADCTSGAMKMVKLNGDKATLKCVSCHKEKDVTR